MQKTRRLKSGIFPLERLPMGEIKSTLDLVMEKTRHMNLSPAERNEKRAEDIEKALRGLVQKYIDGLLRKEPFLDAFSELEDVENHPKEHMLLREILDQIRIDDGPEARRAGLELLEFGCALDPEKLASILNEFDAEKDKAAADRTRELLEQLLMHHQISGSAVVPNLDADAAFTERLNRLQKTCTERLDAEKERLLA